MSHYATRVSRSEKAIFAQPKQENNTQLPPQKLEAVTLVPPTADCMRKSCLIRNTLPTRCEEYRPLRASTRECKLASEWKYYARTKRSHRRRRARERESRVS